MESSMRRAFLIVGFNNWGKTTLVFDLFGKCRFGVGCGYRLQPDIGRCFTVESHSNDDTSEDRYISEIQRRVEKAPADAQDLISVLCPTRDSKPPNKKPGNDACRILNSTAFSPFDEIHLLLLRYKWDLHAELRLEDIKAHLAGCGNKRLYPHVIDEGTHGTDDDRRQRRCKEARDIISSVLGGGNAQTAKFTTP